MITTILDDGGRYLPETDRHGRYVWEAVREGIAPFRPRSIRVFVEYDIDFYRYVLFVEAWFPDYQLRGRADIDVPDLDRDPDLAAFNAAKELFKQFRFREAYPCGPNVELGEN